MNMDGSRRLLAVDDDVDSAELIVRVAERCGFEGFATSDSRGVINLANALKPGIICVDICMPNIDANELLRMLAEAKYDGRVLIVSGQSPEQLLATQHIAEGHGLKVLGVMQKPFNLGLLRQLLQGLTVEKAA